MIVCLNQSFFADPQTPQADLIALLQLGVEGRHIIRTDPLFNREDPTQFAQQWLNQCEARLQQELTFALELDVDDPETTQGTTEIFVEPSPSDWNTNPLHLNLADALLLLRTPFKIILESRGDDWFFLQRMLLSHPNLLPLLRAHYRRGWMEVLHGGGIDGICAYIQGICPHAPEGLPLTHPDQHQLFALFDSDTSAPHVNPPSPVQDAVNACECAHIPYHRLTRRMIENYLPAQALGDWVNRAGSSKGSHRRAALNSFKDLTVTQRHHDDMKKRFGKSVANIFSTRDDSTWRVWMNTETERDLNLRMEQQAIAEKLRTRL